MWLLSSFLTCGCFRQEESYDDLRCGNCSTWTECPSKFLGKFLNQIHLGCWLSLHTSLADVMLLCWAVLSTYAWLLPPIYNMLPGQDDDDRHLYYTRVGLYRWVGSWGLLQPGGCCFNENGIFITPCLSWLPFRGRLVSSIVCIYTYSLGGKRQSILIKLYKAKVKYTGTPPQP